MDPSDFKILPSRSVLSAGRIVRSGVILPLRSPQRLASRARRAGHESLDAVMVSDALHDIAHHLGIEEMQGQAHQLGEEIGDQGDIDPRVYVQQYPAPYEVHG